jgi:hypothetical protein
MWHRARHRSSRIDFFLVIIAAAFFVALPHTALAQHGGGGGGGHAGGGGGGGHFGGSFGGGSSGGSHASAPAPSAHAAPASSAHAAPSRPPLQGYGTAHSFTSVPPANSAQAQTSVDPHAGVLINVPPAKAPAPHMTIGFPPDTAIGAAGTSTAWHFSGPPADSARTGVLSFSGQGHEIWENAPQSSAPALGARTNGPFFADPRATTPLPQRPRVFNPRTQPRFGSGYGFFGPGYFYSPFLFGFGLGLYGPCNAFAWNWDPNWSYDCNSLGYWGYPGGYGGYGYYDYSSGDLYSQPGDSGGADNSSYTPQIAPESSASPESAESNANESSQNPVVLYLNDGTSFSVTDYWVADYKLHYIAGGRESALDLDQIDVQRTVDMNAARGVTVTLKPAPGGAPDAPSTSPAPSNPAPSATQPAPAPPQ